MSRKYMSYVKKQNKAVSQHTLKCLSELTGTVRWWFYLGLWESLSHPFTYTYPFHFSYLIIWTTVDINILVSAASGRGFQDSHLTVPTVLRKVTERFLYIIGMVGTPRIILVSDAYRYVRPYRVWTSLPATFCLSSALWLIRKQMA